MAKFRLLFFYSIKYYWTLEVVFSVIMSMQGWPVYHWSQEILVPLWIRHKKPVRLRAVAAYAGQALLFYVIGTYYQDARSFNSYFKDIRLKLLHLKNEDKPIYIYF